MNILITGGKGYLGKRICAALCEIKSYNVTVTSRTSDSIPNLPKVSVLKVNTSVDNLDKVLSNIDVVIHLAALDAPTCIKKPLEAIDVNIKDTVKWLKASKVAGVKQFFYFSTIHVYGNQLKGNITEEKLPNPVHPYAITHKCAEDYVLAYQGKDHFKSYVFRLSNSFGAPIGEMLQWNLLVPDLCKTSIETKVIPIKSNPLLRRDFIAIEDVVRAVIYFIKNSSILESGVFNLSSNESRTLKEMATLIQTKGIQEFGFKSEIKILSNNLLKSEPFSIDNSKIKKQGFQFKNDVDKEVIDLLKYCNKNMR